METLPGMTQISWGVAQTSELGPMLSQLTEMLNSCPTWALPTWVLDPSEDNCRQAQHLAETQWDDCGNLAGSVLRVRMQFCCQEVFTQLLCVLLPLFSNCAFTSLLYISWLGATFEVCAHLDVHRLRSCALCGSQELIRASKSHRRCEGRSTND